MAGWAKLAAGGGAVLVAAATLILGVPPPPAWADSVKVTPDVFAMLEVNPVTCNPEISVVTSARFDRAVRHDEVRLEFTGDGAPLGLFNSHDLGGATKDLFVWTGISTTLSFKPGTITVRAVWSARTGNGLSTGYGASSYGLPVSFNTIGKLDDHTKCRLQQLANSDIQVGNALAAGARSLGAAGCFPCLRAGLDEAATMAYDLAQTKRRMAMDPPDSQYTVLVTVLTPSFPPIVSGSGISAGAASALNDLMHRWVDAASQAHAAVTAVERAQGAHIAGDRTWEERQSLAAAGFLRGLVTSLNAVPAAMDAAATSMAGGGFPTATVDAAAVAAYALDVLAAGTPPLPPALPPTWLQDQAGLSAADISEMVASIAIATDGFSGPVTLPDALRPTGYAAAVAETISALNTNADQLTADPLLNYADQPSPSPPGPTDGPTSAPPTTAPEQPSLIANGGFETPTLTPGTAYQTMTAQTQPSLSGWQIQHGSIDIVATGGAQAATGTQFIDLNGNDSAAGPGTITQQIAVTPGHRYRLSFQLAGNPNGDPPVKSVEVTAGGQRKTFSFDTTGHTNADLGWTTYTMEVDAGCGGASTMTVIFASRTQGIRGANLDNVMLSDIGKASCSSFPIWSVTLGMLVLIAAAAIALYVWRRDKRARPTASTAEVTTT